jgi:hypothetical protein
MKCEVDQVPTGVLQADPRDLCYFVLISCTHQSTRKVNRIADTCCRVSLQQSPLWSSGQSSWLQIQRPGFDFQRHQIFWKLVGQERGPLSLASTTEELLGRKCSGSGLENRDKAVGDPPSWPRGTLYPQKLALTLTTSGGRSFGIVSSRAQTTQFVCLFPYN